MCNCNTCVEGRALWVPDTCKYGAMGDGSWNWERCERLFEESSLEPKQDTVLA